ncbi:PAS domain S-box protein [Deinococcus peraridilitoris]|uniref:PAS domain S-box protein n=1 Tax=Deinococcus peraridilitoris TaxID=432329 RepID=UPI0002E1376B|nr:PAS domain S-box protein [Deinococcus peraridilitoris]
MSSPQYASTLDALITNAVLMENLFQQASIGFALYDRELRFVRLNEALAEMTGQPMADHLGRKVTEVLPSLPAFVSEAYRQTLQDGVARNGLAFDLELPHAPGEVFHRVVSIQAVRDAQHGIVGLAASVEDHTQRERLRRDLHMRETQARQLQDVTTALSKAVTAGDVKRVVLQQTVRATGAYGGTLIKVLDEQTLYMVGNVGYDDTVELKWQRFPANSNFPVVHAIKTRRPVFATRSEVKTQYPDLSPLLKPETRAVAALPLLSGDQVLSGLTLCFTDELAIAPQQQAFMLSLVEQCAFALERARLYDAEYQARERATLLSEASAALSSSLDVQETLSRITSLALQHGADWCAVHQADGRGRMQPVAVAHEDPRKVELLRTFLSRFPSDPQVYGTGAWVMRTGESVLIPVVPPAMIDALRDEEQRAAVREMGFHSLIVVPMTAQGQRIGVLMLATTQPERTYGQEDLKLASELAQRAALALENARLHENLQRSGERYRELLDHVPQIVFTVNAEGKVEQVNQRWEEYTGASLLCALERWIDFFHPNDRERSLDERARRIQKSEPYSYEARLLGADGEYRWMLIQAQPVHDALTGALRGWVGGITDIHERKQAEQAVHDSRARLRFALDAAGLGDWELDLRDHSSWRSLRHDEIFGYPQGHPTWTYETFLEHVVPPDRAEVDLQFRRAQELGEPWEVECRVRRADGEERWIWTRARTLSDQEGQPHHMLGIVGDITDLKRAEAEVRALNSTLEERVELRTQALEAQKASLDAFVSYAEAVGTQTDPLALAREALTVLQARFADASIAYYEPEGELWKARVWTQDLREDIVARITAGVSSDLPLFARTLGARQEVFVDGWNPQQQVDITEQYDSGAAYPLIINTGVAGMLLIGLRNTPQWSERDRSVVRAVGRSLNLALERAHQATRLALQNAELEARTRALDGFASLTRDFTLQSDPLALVRRAQEVIMSMLPDGHAAYYELEGTVWRLRAIVGEFGNSALQAAVEAGIPYETTRNFIPPWTTGQPYYQDHYDTRTDNLAEVTQHFAASAVLPVMVTGKPVGVLAVALFHQRHWTSTDKAVLEGVVRHLGLALEGARSVAQLAQRTRELERSNRDLEQFAYVASHDLQEPLRTITSYTELLARRYGGQLDQNAEQFMRFTVDAAKRMRQLVQDLLTVSRLRAEDQQLSEVNANEVMELLVQDLQEAIRQGGACVRWDELPHVRVDAVQFRQLLQNLVGNAIKFRHADVPLIVHVRAARQGGFQHFEVCDNGIGIEERYFKRIFTVFQRLHGREQYDGTGVGLAICKQIVERHGGQLWVESRLGAGSTFHFTLPISHGEADV